MPTKTAAPAPIGDTPDDWQMPLNNDTERRGVSVLGTQTPSPFVDPESEEDDILDRIRQAIGGAPTDSITVKVSRNGEWLDDLSFDEWEDGGNKLLRKKYGAGRFQLSVYSGATATRKGGLIMRPTVRIGSAPEPISSQSAPPSETAELLRAMAQNQATFQQQMMQIVQTLAHRPERNPQAEMMEMLTMAKTMREAFAPPQNVAFNPVDIVKQIADTTRAMREINEEIGGGNRDPESPMALLGQLAGPVLEMIKQRQGGAAPAQPFPALTMPQSMAGNPAASIEGATETEDNPMLAKMMLRGFVGELKTMIQRGETAQAGGDFIYQNIPEQMVPMLSVPNWFEVLCAEVPEAREHQAWIVGARDRTLALFAQAAAE